MLYYKCLYVILDASKEADVTVSSHTKAPFCCYDNRI